MSDMGGANAAHTTYINLVKTESPHLCDFSQFS